MTGECMRAKPDDIIIPTNEDCDFFGRECVVVDLDVQPTLCNDPFGYIWAHEKTENHNGTFWLENGDYRIVCSDGLSALCRVQQMDERGCTIACMAMITGVHYFDVRKVLHEHVDRLSQNVLDPTLGSIGVYCDEMQKVLEEHFGVKSKFVKFESLDALRKHCVLFICPVNWRYPGSGHAVVFDALQRRILDPSRESIDNIGEYNVYCCLEIY